MERIATDLSAKLTFLETRLTICERELQILSAKNFLLGTPPSGKIVKLKCDEPGLFASNAYQVEHDSAQRAFCWIGAPDTMQIILPAVPARAFLCKLYVKPRDAVSFNSMVLLVNDCPMPFHINYSDAENTIVFKSAASLRPHIEVVLEGVASIRPCDIGESADVRLIAFRFFGAEVEYLAEENTEVRVNGA